MNRAAPHWLGAVWNVAPNCCSVAVVRELQASYAELADGEARVEALEELERLSLELAAELRRPLTVFDVIRAASDSTERTRRMELVRVLRRPA